MTISENTVVSIHYTLTNDAGEVLDSSSGGEPLTYLHGASNIIPGLEAALQGRKVGDQFKVSVAPKDGYGERIDALVQRIPKNQFAQPDQLQKGMQFQIQGPNGPLILTVVEVSNSDVVVDGNPELAGQNLHFDVEVTDVRQASSEEIEHGHAHGSGGHHH